MLLFSLLSFFSLFLCPCVSYLNNWFPVASISTTDLRHPQQIRILGKDFVLWKKNKQIVLQDDSCPHRCAPLSEGYIDRKSKNLRCAYHGWEFDQKGSCTVIPQMDDERTVHGCRANVNNYVVQEHGDMLWAYFGNISEHTVSPKEKYDFGTGSTSVFVREIPYSLHVLLENFFDPAHVSFAHHKLQSHRDEGCPIYIRNATLYPDQLSILFANKNKDARVGKMNFELPCYYHMETMSGKLSILHALHVFVVPIQEDSTRIFLTYDYNQKHPLYKWIKRMPLWLSHIFTNRFLDSDTYLLYKQEQFLKASSRSFLDNKEYYLPSESDQAVTMYRKWFKRALPTIPFFAKKSFGRELTRKEVLDRFQQHTAICSVCKSSFQNVQKAQKWGSVFLLLSFYATKRLPFLVSYLIYFTILDTIRKQFLFQDYIHDKID